VRLKRHICRTALGRSGQCKCVHEARDWLAWHRGYDDPGSSLSRRLGVIQREIERALDALPSGRRRALSLCAGDGRDLIPVLARHRRRDDLSAVLVELDPALAEAAQARADQAGLHESIEVRQLDAGQIAAFDDVLPADLLLLCGIFGNVSEADIRATVEAAASKLLGRGGHVIWTRGASEPDLRRVIRNHFLDCGFKELLFEGEPHGFGVGVDRLTARRESPGPDGDRLFTFVH
jgi:hypothetical protein